MKSAERIASKIPTFASLREEATFWDNHSLTEFDNEFRLVDVEVAQPLGHILSIRIDSEHFRRLCALADHRGSDITTLAEDWLREAIDAADATESGGSAS